ncbi:hypothetical protein M0765_000510 [Variovorax sp. S2]|uniref:hypothetical protein n=1 Tax=Variovorax sp. S12S4 TaxID=3029170 RepID=UPI00215C35BC|nr:hypothetical protein [Variovorax sp. S12S4]MCR8956263.1 hypothetical protein [Variovorax sp. S12S4]
MLNLELQEAISTTLEARSKKVLNRNAWVAFAGVFSDPVGALGKLFLGRGEALEAEEGRIKQDIALDLLCKIDEAISSALRESSEKGISLDGLIEAVGHGSGSVTGLDISPDAKNIQIKPGTKVSATSHGSGSVTGMRIG